MEDMEEAMKLMPGTAKLNIHASYAIFEPGEFADRDALEPKHFAKWVEFAKKHHMGIDFNPTFFSHEKEKDGTAEAQEKALILFRLRAASAPGRLFPGRKAGGEFPAQSCRSQGIPLVLEQQLYTIPIGVFQCPLN